MWGGTFKAKKFRGVRIFWESQQKIVISIQIEWPSCSVPLLQWFTEKVRIVHLGMASSAASSKFILLLIISPFLFGGRTKIWGLGPHGSPVAKLTLVHEPIIELDKNIFRTFFQLSKCARFNCEGGTIDGMISRDSDTSKPPNVKTASIRILIELSFY